MHALAWYPVALYTACGWKEHTCLQGTSGVDHNIVLTNFWSLTTLETISLTLQQGRNVQKLIAHFLPKCFGWVEPWIRIEVQRGQTLLLLIHPVVPLRGRNGRKIPKKISAVKMSGSQGENNKDIKDCKSTVRLSISLSRLDVHMHERCTVSLLQKFRAGGMFDCIEQWIQHTMHRLHSYMPKLTMKEKHN